ncbi:hypothetical protein [Acuticoccus sp. I52.16.1]|uniref:hypothetical protein n=1 Tax=Acuticoccus sp. I52.16.1 TaxID=2928472 RepID=UPI001FD384D3|nr:hypothetical protein [Acuticoccus sp. I52.16.1]UOM34123.1 hypothetical protein MRB58_20200 [Acuticoccus sp. I52.16.1]
MSPERAGAPTIRPTPTTPPRFWPLSLAFRDPRIECLFIADNNQRAVGPVRALGALCIALVALLAVFDLVTGSPAATALLPGRLLGIAAVAGALALSRSPTMVRWGQLVLAGFFIALNGGLYLSVQSYGSQVLAMIPAFIMALAMTLVLPALLFRLALPIAAVATLAYAERMVIFMPGVTCTIPILFLVSTLLVLAFGAYASERGRREAWATRRALAKEMARGRCGSGSTPDPSSPA